MTLVNEKSHAPERNCEYGKSLESGRNSDAAKNRKEYRETRKKKLGNFSAFYWHSFSNF